MKGGTTALYDFICLHEKVEPAKNKEIHFFSLNLHEGIEWYLTHFPNFHDKISGEASPTYFDIANTKTIPLLIKKYFPNTKIILIVRDPIERAVSHYFHLCKVNKIEELINLDINDFFLEPFENAIKQTTSKLFYLNQILSFSCYYRKFLYYNSVFGENILVVSNADLKLFPYETMEKVFIFLDLDPIESIKFKEFKYSSGSNTNILTNKIRSKLESFLYPDYELFCKKTGISNKIKPTIYNYKPEDKKVQIEEDNEVQTGKDGWIFLTGGSNKPLQYYKDKGAFNDQIVKDWDKLLINRNNILNQLGTQYIHLFVPDKLSIYPEFFDDYLEFYDGHPLSKYFTNIDRRLPKNLIDKLIDPTDFFKKQKKEYLMYWKTDTHWTFYGCYSAYQLICNSLGIEQNVSILQRDYSEGSILMDLGGKINPKIKETARFYNILKDSHRIYSNQIVNFKEMTNNENEIGLHVGSHVIFRNNKCNNNIKTILFGDSYSEYRTHLLTGMLAETFSELHFIWSTSFDFNYIKKINPDIVISEIAERFMPSIPTDDFSLENYVKMKMKQLNISD